MAKATGTKGTDTIIDYGSCGLALVTGIGSKDAARAHRIVAEVLATWGFGGAAWHVSEVRGGYAVVCEACREGDLAEFREMLTAAAKAVSA